ncbi:MAG: flippase-like domain-containing protein, partial [Clostridia bacterium]|nr:flippase-like domain-containing protein [Clostridia bacterium]
YVSAMTVAMVVVLLCSNELPEMIDTLGQLNLRWVLAAGALMIGYLCLRVLTLRFYLQRNGYFLSLRDAIGVTGTGQFYSAITPSASGGQPMQVLRLHQKGVPASIGTACISVKFLGFQAAFISMGLGLLVSHWRFVNEQLYGWRWLVALGYLLNVGLIGAVLMTIPKLKLVDRFAAWVLRLGAKLRIVRHPEDALARFDAMLAEYREALLSLWRRPMDALVVYGLSLLQVGCFMSVVVCTYHAFSFSGCPAHILLTLQLQLFVAAAFIPLPGAAGAQESGFFFFFHGIFPETAMTAAILVWRFFTYYMLLLLGFFMMAIGGMRKKDE